MINQNEVYRQAGKIIQAAIKRKKDEKPLAMLDYFLEHFDELRHGWIPSQDFMRGCKNAWGKAGE